MTSAKENTQAEFLAEISCVFVTVTGDQSIPNFVDIIYGWFPMDMCFFSREWARTPLLHSPHTMIWSVSGDIVNSEFLSTRRLKLLAPHSNEMPRVKTRVKEGLNSIPVVRYS